MIPHLPDSPCHEKGSDQAAVGGLGVLLLPFAFAASLITVPIEGGFGSDRSRPTGAAELSDEYRLVGGQIYLDLTRIEDTGEPIEISASVALGELNVFLPDDAGLELDASVGGGQVWTRQMELQLP